MKKKLIVTLAAAAGAWMIGGCANQAAVQATTAAETTTAVETAVAETTAEEAEKKEDAAILVVSFGTSYNDSRDVTIGAVETAIGNAFPEYEVRRAFTSQIIIDILEERDSLEIDNVTEALDRAVSDGIKELVVQPTHLMNGFEYQDLVVELTDYLDEFDKVILGEPLLTSDADFEAVASAIAEKTASYDDGKTAICFMGHGTEADSNVVYGKLQETLTDGGYENYYIGTVEAAPALDDVTAALKANGSYEKVVLEPLMLVAGDHANNDMAGSEEDSWKTVLEKEGYEVECIIEGLGQIPAIQELYVEHVSDALKSGAEFMGVTVSEGEKIAAEDLQNGTYTVEIESSSSMFKIKRSELVVKDGEMSAVLTMNSDAYTKLFMGTAEDAAKAEEADCIAVYEDENGECIFEIPVSGLDQPFDCAAYSKNKETWYDRQLTVKSSTVSAVSESAETEAAENEAAVTAAVAENGTYTIDVTLNGGSGKSTVISPASIRVEDGAYVATIQWSSPNYDYMIVDGEKYLQTNTEGDSVFEIPVSALDEEIPVIGDTVAMSKPHEVEYTIIFHSDSMKAAE